jgi:hypothetical protein
VVVLERRVAEPVPEAVEELQADKEGRAVLVAQEGL